MKKLFSVIFLLGGLSLGLSTQASVDCCDNCAATTWCEYRCPQGGKGCGDGDGYSCSYHKNCGDVEEPSFF